MCSNLTDQLLKLARYDTGDTLPEFAAVDATALLRDCIADVLPLADYRCLDIGLDVGSDDGGGGPAPNFVDGIEEDLRFWSAICSTMRCDTLRKTAS